MLNKIIYAVLFLVYRPTLNKLQEELATLYENTMEHLVSIQVNKESVRQAVELRSGAIKYDTLDNLIGNLNDDLATYFTHQLLLSNIPLKASLLNVSKYFEYQAMLLKVRDTIRDKAVLIFRVKLINAMAELDFKRTFGVSREEWEKSNPVDDSTEALIDKIGAKQELPEDIKSILKELGGVMLPHVDYSQSN